MQTIFAKFKMSTSRITRKFERFLFNGIPEQPEPIWERDSHTNVSVRHTGRSQAASDYNNSGESKLIGYYTYDFEKELESYTSLVKE